MTTEQNPPKFFSDELATACISELPAPRKNFSFSGWLKESIPGTDVKIYERICFLQFASMGAIGQPIGIIKPHNSQGVVHQIGLDANQFIEKVQIDGMFNGLELAGVNVAGIFGSYYQAHMEKSEKALAYLDKIDPRPATYLEAAAAVIDEAQEKGLIDIGQKPSDDGIDDARIVGSIAQEDLLSEGEVSDFAQRAVQQTSGNIITDALNAALKAKGKDAQYRDVIIETLSDPSTFAKLAGILALNAKIFGLERVQAFLQQDRSTEILLNSQAEPNKLFVCYAVCTRTSFGDVCPVFSPGALSLAVFFTNPITHQTEVVLMSELKPTGQAAEDYIAENPAMKVVSDETTLKRLASVYAMKSQAGEVVTAEIFNERFTKFAHENYGQSEEMFESDDAQTALLVSTRETFLQALKTHRGPHLVELDNPRITTKDHIYPAIAQFSLKREFPGIGNWIALGWIALFHSPLNNSVVIPLFDVAGNCGLFEYTPCTAEKFNELYNAVQYNDPALPIIAAGVFHPVLKDQPGLTGAELVMAVQMARTAGSLSDIAKFENGMIVLPKEYSVGFYNLLNFHTSPTEESVTTDSSTDGTKAD